MDEEECPLEGSGGGKAGEGGGWRRALARRLPVLAWAPRYTAEAALADAVAGATLGLTLVPQSIAYAALADLPVQYGLYSSFLGTMLYVLLGTVKEVSIGPTSLMALLTLQTCRGLPVQYVVLLTFLSGCCVLACGLLRLGFMVELLAPAVTSGFTSATAVIIVVSQLKGLLGLAFVADSVPENLALLWSHAAAVRPADCALAAACCAALLLLRKLKDVPVSAKRPRLRKALWVVSIARNAVVVLTAAVVAYCTRDPAAAAHPYFKLSGNYCSTLWVVSIARNAVVVLLAAVVAYCTRDPAASAHPYFKLSGRVQGGFPPLGLPLSAPAPGGNGTVGFAAMTRTLGPALLLLPAVMVLANIAIAKAFSEGGRVDATQEMVTLGICNMAGALVSSMPTCGAFTRSAVAASSGVRTPLAGLYSGIITLLALMFLTEYFYFIPKATLSSVLICAVIFMIDYQTVLRLWRWDRCELAILLVTFAVSMVLSVEVALLAGAACSLARLLRRLMRPKLALTITQTRLGPVVVVRGVSSLVYANAEHVCARLARAAAPPGDSAAPADGGGPRALLLDCAQLAAIDLPAIEALTRLSKKLEETSQQLILFNATPAMARKLARLPGAPAALAAPTVAEAAAAAAAANGVAADTKPAEKDPLV